MNSMISSYVLRITADSSSWLKSRPGYIEVLLIHQLLEFLWPQGENGAPQTGLDHGKLPPAPEQVPWCPAQAQPPMSLFFMSASVSLVISFIILVNSAG